MLEYIHELPADLQRENATHAQLGGSENDRIIIFGGGLHAQVSYGTLDEDGEFVSDSYSGRHKLTIDDWGSFLQSSPTMDTLPTSIEEQLLANAKGLALYADANDLWPGL